MKSEVQAVKPEPLHTTATAARALGFSEAWVRKQFDKGAFEGGIRDASRRRLIPASQVEKMRRASR